MGKSSYRGHQFVDACCCAFDARDERLDRTSACDPAECDFKCLTLENSAEPIECLECERCPGKLFG
jgi:hypothetical protein